MTATNVGGKGEVWKDVPGYEGFYQASNFGRVRSIDRLVPCKGGAFNIRKGKILKEGKHKKGYLLVILAKNGLCVTYSVHSIIALAFIGPRPLKYDINHINGLKTDNRCTNLEYVTAKENQLHAFRLNLRKPRKAKHPKRKTTPKLTLDQVAEIRQLSFNKWTVTQIARKLGKCYNTVNSVLKGRTFISVQ
ncbi:MULTISPECIES: NUMOD4 domain-containing protein [unclassified Spirosoma]|uniref:NUMOD4 motif-containing HNH endonuclease n=1 Tax=unclassified Spirosoma TaxID=2621999 RepID=UPI00095C238C|nr:MULTISPECIES: NUMOD4 domain-containing protein [unclassified Spirosoma]MBN8825087.1 HNH endonuclease [Spirosoma sp.]OJW77219.1 MAG: hypothetical protein BGO59_31700 [Spirosoma sp. 48-14]